MTATFWNLPSNVAVALHFLKKNSYKGSKVVCMYNITTFIMYIQI